MLAIREPINSISIQTTSRLHLGFMDLNGALGRRFGSIGVSIAEPFTRLTLTKHRDLKVTGAGPAVAQRIKGYAAAYAAHWGVDPGVAIQVHEHIPEHKGLGSGTQMAMAVSTGLARLYGMDSSARHLAEIGGRGKRSSIGIQSFVGGGFVVDAGKSEQTSTSRSRHSCPPQTLIRMDFPKEWLFVIVVPDDSVGLSGEKESAAISGLTPSGENAGRICRLVMMKLLPAFLERDIEAFGQAVSELDYRTGLFFKSAQGGVYSETRSGRLVEGLIRAGAYGAGQSSWGPAVYGLVLASQAAQVAGRMTEFLNCQGIKGQVMVAAGANHGALVESDGQPVPGPVH